MTERAQAQDMDVTVVIPTYNRGDALRSTLAALSLNDYPPDRWECVVVDDGSTEEIELMVRRAAEELGINIRYLRQPNSGPSAARNRGAMAARGRILIFIDNDILVDPGFIRNHVQALTEHPGCWMIGRVTHPPPLRETPFGRYRDAIHERYHLQFPEMLPYLTEWVTTQNLSLPAEDFRRLNGFDESFTIASSEDWELGFRARRQGISLYYHPGIVALHNDWAVSLEKYCERQRLYSLSDVLLWRMYGEECPRARLVRENAPIEWRNDPLRLICKKIVKRALATGAGRMFVRTVCAISERLASDSRWSWRAYDLAIGIAIFRGVREGLKRYNNIADPMRQGRTIDRRNTGEGVVNRTP